MDSEMIIETAALMLEADKTENEDEARRLMDKLDGREVALVHVAYKLLSGKPFRVNTNMSGFTCLSSNWRRQLARCSSGQNPASSFTRQSGIEPGYGDD